MSSTPRWSWTRGIDGSYWLKFRNIGRLEEFSATALDLLQEDVARWEKPQALQGSKVLSEIILDEGKSGVYGVPNFPY